MNRSDDLWSRYCEVNEKEGIVNEELIEYSKKRKSTPMTVKLKFNVYLAIGL